MNKALLGIDLGTSSVKVLLYHPDGRIEKARAAYEEISPAGWLRGMQKALSALDCRRVGAISLSAQTGTYIVNGKTVIGWSDPAGREELPRIRDAFSADHFVREIGMPHPAILSYPLPRMLYMKQHFGAVEQICQPKDLLLTYLTGERVSDIWTWRGLAHPETGAYSKALLAHWGLDAAWLPPLAPADRVVGRVTPSAAAETGLPVGTPVVNGLNDFFAGLVGMGIPTLSPLFDVTGTSEHFGAVEEQFTPETGLVSGRFLRGFVRYGGTASSGTSLAFGRREFGPLQGDPAAFLAEKPPLFLPYLNGERAPIFDSNARGVFFGMGKDCDKQALSYAVLEGVAFSMYQIAEHLGHLPEGRILLGGGAARDPLLGQLKATLFDRAFVTLRESDTSALGAAMLAGLGSGAFADLQDAVRTCVQTDTVFSPVPAVREALLSRYAVFKRLYPALKDEFQLFKEI